MGLISGQSMTPGKPLGAAIAGHAGRRSGGRVAGGAVAAAGAAHEIGNHAADGEADRKQDGQGEPEKGAGHALGRPGGLHAAGRQREDGGQGGAGGEGEAGKDGMVQEHGADARLQGEGDSESGAKVSDEAALGELRVGEEFGVVRRFEGRRLFDAPLDVEEVGGVDHQD